MNRLARSPTLIATHEHEHLPLHVQDPPVPFLDWKKADEVVRLAAPIGEERVWFEMGAVFRSKEAAADLHRRRDVELDVSPTADSCFSAADVNFMSKARFCVPLPEEPVAFVRLFAVVELKKQRRRLIGWPRAINSAERLFRAYLKTLHADVLFPQAQEVRDKVRFRYAAQLDLKKFFQQFELHTKEFFAVNLGGKAFGLATIPTGGVAPPLIAQVLTRSVCALAIRLAGATDVVFYDCMIDNLRLVSDNFALLQAAWAEVLRILDALGVTIGDIQHPQAPMEPYTYLGMLFDHNLGTVRPAEGLSAKLDLARRVISAESAPGRDLQAAFGVCIWASLVTDYPLFHAYHVFKFMRRRSREGLDDSLTEIWPSVQPQWRDWIDHVSNASFTYIPSRKVPCEATLFTDACDDGWGMVCFEPSGKTSIFGDKFSETSASLHINEKELLAVKYAVSRLHLPPGTRVTIYIDNTTAEAWLRNRRAPGFRTNAVVSDIYTALRLANLDLTGIFRVASADNPADAPSRL